MTGGHSMSEQRDCHGDAAAYALGALEPEEVEEFRRHLASCVVCRDELAAFQQVADSLPMSASQYEAPRGLRRRVVRAVRAQQAAASERPARALRSPIPIRQLAIAAAAVVVVGLALVAGIELGSGGSGTRLIPAVIGSADVRLSGGHGELIVHRLAPPPPGQIYQLWLQHGHQSPSPTCTLFSVTSAGGADVGLPGDLHGVRAVLVTAEPAGGTQVPTHAPVIEAQLT